jgi:hypothetical protein
MGTRPEGLELWRPSPRLHPTPRTRVASLRPQQPSPASALPPALIRVWVVAGLLLWPLVAIAGIQPNTDVNRYVVLVVFGLIAATVTLLGWRGRWPL